MRHGHLLITALIFGAAPALAQEPEGETGAPLSAIPWLTDSLNTPPDNVLISEPAIAKEAGFETISTSEIGGTVADAVGILPVSITGFPRELWGPTPAMTLAQAIKADMPEMVPALMELRNRLLLAELDPPFDADASGLLFQARIDKLLDIGALDQALALLERAGPASPQLFPRYFDVALLTGAEDRACQYLAASPTLDPTYPVRIFCLARNGEWDNAVVTLTGAHSLDLIGPVEFALLARFLDPELFEGEEIPDLPRQVTPLVFKLLEAVDVPLATTDLPRAFAFTDLDQTRGWKAQIEAAERLVRAGAIDPARLIALYTFQKPAASGGVWERAAALQRVEAALGDAEALSRALPEAWQRMEEAGLLTVLSTFINGRINPSGLSPEGRDIAYKLAMLGPSYEAWALDHPAETEEQKLYAAIARGRADAATASPKARAALAAFEVAGIPEKLTPLLDDGRRGEAILEAMRLFATGAQGNWEAFTDGIAGLRALGLESTARRATLESLILSPS